MSLSESTTDDPSENKSHISPDDLLPPVEPPSASFLLQLFVLPAVIVVGIVCIWLLFGWMVNRTSHRPEDIIQGLEGTGPARWQRASELADMLRSPRYPEFRQSEAAATQLGELLQRELQTATSRGGMSDAALNLRYFLCRALGEFEVSEGLDALLSAANTGRNPEETLVRRGAIQAIAVRTYTLQNADPPIAFDGGTVEAALLELSQDEDPLIRSETAFALGRLGTPTSMQRLQGMVDDPHADTRYNAAIGLAAQGDLNALETLAEMLDPSEMKSVEEEAGVDAQRIKRAVIIKNALQATRQLAVAQPQADFTDVIASLDQLVQLEPRELQEARVDPLLVSQAEELLNQLSRR